MTLIELACETDFAAKTDRLHSLWPQGGGRSGAAAVSADSVDGGPSRLPRGADRVEQLIADEAAIIGEKVELRRVRTSHGEHFEITISTRRAPTMPPQIGVVVAYTGSDARRARSIAQHISFANPSYLAKRRRARGRGREGAADPSREISRNEGKPEAALPKIVEGRVGAFFKQVALLEQDYAKDNKLSVGKVASDAGITITDFVRFKVARSPRRRPR